MSNFVLGASLLAKVSAWSMQFLSLSLETKTVPSVQRERPSDTC